MRQVHQLLRVYETASGAEILGGGSPDMKATLARVIESSMMLGDAATKYK